MGKRTKTDPTGQARQRNITARKMKARLAKARREILDLFNQIPRRRSSEQQIVNTLIYEYDTTPAQEAELARQIDVILADWLLETTLNTMPANWWFKNQVEQPYRQGTIQTAVVLNKQVAIALAAGVLVAGFPPRRIDRESLLRSVGYREGLQRTYNSGWQALNTLQSTTATQVTREIITGMTAKESPRIITDAVNDRFRVAFSSANRTSDTEVNQAYTEGALTTTEGALETTGLRGGVLHISALLTTTRVTHAKRHGNAYTVADQEAWWDRDGNRINCHCSVVPVLRDAAGNLIDSRTQEVIQAEREFF